MPDVLLDGALVSFSGPPPATLGEVRLLLEHALGEQQRVLAGLVVDGAPWQDDMAARPFAGTGRLEAASLTLAAAMAQLAGTLAPALAAVRERADAVAGEVLRVAWPEARAQAIALAGELRQVLESATGLAASAGGDSGLARAVATLADGVGAWMDAVEAGDAAAACLRLDGPVLQALAGLRAALDSLNPAAS